MSSVEKPVLRQLERDGLADRIGREHFFGFTGDVVVACDQTLR